MVQKKPFFFQIDLWYGEDMDQKMHLIPQRRLAMTLALQRSLAILQMPQMELAEWLTQEIETNPLLEEVGGLRSHSPLPEIETPTSLYEHLLSQIRDHFPDPVSRKCAEKCVEFLDEKGFFSLSLEEITKLLEIDEASTRLLLETLKTFDPPGIFAKSLQEALLIQLRVKGKEMSPVFSLVRDHFDDFTQKRYGEIRKKLKNVDFKEAIRILSKLRMRPAEAFHREVVPLPVADLRFIHQGNSWRIETQEEQLPQFVIKEEYAALQEEAVRSWLASAKWLTRSLKRRRQILLQVGAALLQKQSGYLLQRRRLQVITLQSLASELSLHESTLSRAVGGKYVETPRGLIPLRSLVTLTPALEETKRAMAELIAQEDRNAPLSDEELSQKLQGRGWKVARRTVAKYRQELHIPTAAARKFTA